MNSVEFIIIYILLLTVIATAQQCVKLSSCSCKVTLPEMEVIFDLNELDKATPNGFIAPDVNIKDQYEYLYQPCREVQQSECGKTGVTVCQRSTTALKNTFDAGNRDSAVFSGDPLTDNLVIRYTATTDAVVRVSNIHMICDETATTFKQTSKHESLTGDQVYNFTLSTSYACVNVPIPKAEHKLSTGSVLLIIFFVFLGVYFIAGILYLKFARGATGSEMVPNYGFWSSLPGYIKDGVMFTFRGCKTESSYSQI